MAASPGDFLFPLATLTLPVEEAAQGGPGQGTRLCFRSTTAGLSVVPHPGPSPEDAVSGQRVLQKARVRPG